MTIAASEKGRSGPYDGGFGVADFDYSFTIYRASELTAFRRNADGSSSTLTYPTDFTLTGIGNRGGGQLILSDTDLLPSGTTLTLVPSITLSQERPFSAQSTITLEQIEEALDKLTSISKDLRQRVDQSLSLSPDVQSEVVLQAQPETGATLIFDVNGNLVVGPTASDIAGAQDAAASVVGDAEEVRELLEEYSASSPEFEPFYEAAKASGGGTGDPGSYDFVNTYEDQLA